MSETITRNKLTSEQQVFIIERLASFHTPSEIRAELKEIYGAEISLAALSYYDPATLAGRRLKKGLRELFERSRAAFIFDASGQALSHKNYRLRELGKLYAKAVSAGNLVLAKDLLKQAAQEAGQWTDILQLDFGKLPDEVLEKLAK